MSGIEGTRRHMEGLQDLRGIVRTMKSLSAASISQFEEAVEALADYYRTVELGLAAVSGVGPAAPARPRVPGPDIVVVFGSDHGLCGGFNEDVVQRLQDHVDCDRPYRLLAVGARLEGPIQDAGLHVHRVIDAPGSASRITASVQEQLLILDAWHSDAGLASLSLCYNHHTRRGAYRAVCVPVLPVDLDRLRRRAGAWPSRSVPMHTLPTRELRAALARQYVFVSAFRACAESQASEHGSRLLAMQAAEKNLDRRLDEVAGELRRTRQAAITAELLDVVAGYEALAASPGETSRGDPGRPASGGACLETGP